MEIYERIRLLRKDHLHLTMKSFGEKLGVSIDVISNIEKNRLAKPNQKLSLYKLICSEFGVNEEWLLNGTGEMFSKSPSSMLEIIKEELQLDDFSYGLVREYLNLSPEQRKKVRDFFYQVVKPNSESYVCNNSKVDKHANELS